MYTCVYVIFLKKIVFIYLIRLKFYFISLLVNTKCLQYRNYKKNFKSKNIDIYNFVKR